MSPKSDDRSPDAPAAAPRDGCARRRARRWRSCSSRRDGFVWFLAQLHGVEVKPDRNADGIVVLTGGSSRVADAMDLLAGGYGKRLLISGVHPANAASDISRSLPDNQSLLALLRRSRPLCRQHPQQCRRNAALGAGARLQVADRGDVELPYAARDRRIVARMPDVLLIPFPVVGEKWRDEPWWTSGATLRLLVTEYAKFVAAEVRVRLADAGLDLRRISDHPPDRGARKPATPQATDELPMVSIFIRSPLFNAGSIALLVLMELAHPVFLYAAARFHGGGKSGRTA